MRSVCVCVFFVLFYCANKGSSQGQPSAACAEDVSLGIITGTSTVSADGTLNDPVSVCIRCGALVGLKVTLFTDTSNVEYQDSNGVALVNNTNGIIITEYGLLINDPASSFTDGQSIVCAFNDGSNDQEYQITFHITIFNPPLITPNVSVLNVVEGEDVRLTCTGDPAIVADRYQWLLPDGTVFPENRAVADNGLVLQLNNIENGQSGAYTCIGTLVGSEGERESEITVNVAVIASTNSKFTESNSIISTHEDDSKSVRSSTTGTAVSLSSLHKSVEKSSSSETTSPAASTAVNDGATLNPAGYVIPVLVVVVLFIAILVLCIFLAYRYVSNKSKMKRGSSPPVLFANMSVVIGGNDMQETYHSDGLSETNSDQSSKSIYAAVVKKPTKRQKMKADKKDLLLSAEAALSDDDSTPPPPIIPFDFSLSEGDEDVDTAVAIDTLAVDNPSTDDHKDNKKSHLEEIIIGVSNNSNTDENDNELVTSNFEQSSASPNGKEEKENETKQQTQASSKTTIVYAELEKFQKNVKNSLAGKAIPHPSQKEEKVVYSELAHQSSYSEDNPPPIPQRRQSTKESKKVYKDLSELASFLSSLEPDSNN